MTNIPEITVNVAECLGVNKYNVDEDNAHIELASADLNSLDATEFGKLVRVCPAALYQIDPDGNRIFDYAGCLECGTCRIACGGTIVTKWELPGPFMGVQYRYG